MIVATMSTIPERGRSFLSLLHRMLYEQTLHLDRLYVCLHRYDRIESWLPQDSRLRYTLGRASEGPWVRYRVAQELNDDDVLLTLDDDTIYPKDYVERSVADLRRVGARAVVCYGGLRWDPFVDQFEYYTPFRTLILGHMPLRSDFRVAILQGICTVMYAGDAKGAINLRLPGFNTNDDLLMSYHLQHRGVKILCCKKEAQWLTLTDDASAAHALVVRDKSVRAKTFHRMVYELGFDPTAGWLDEMRAFREHILVLADSNPLREPELNENVTKLCGEKRMVHVLAPMGRSELAGLPLPSDLPYAIHPSPVPDRGGRFEAVSFVRRWRDARIRWQASQFWDKRMQAIVNKLPQTKLVELRNRDA